METPRRANKRTEATTRSRCRFFDAFDDRTPGETIGDVCRGIDFKWTTRMAQNMLRLRRRIGREAYYRPGKHRDHSNQRVSDEQVNALLNPKNPVREQPYTIQASYFGIQASKRTIQKYMAKNKVQRYKKAIVRSISSKNTRQRETYGWDHQGHTIANFWQFVYFTDECHIDPHQISQAYVLRPQGTRYNVENLQQEPLTTTGVKLHLAASVSWHHKSPLQFYNDENDHLEPPKRPRKPRKSKYETEEQHHNRVIEWEAHLPHAVDVQPKGNLMTQQYYTDRLLPVYIHEVHMQRIYHNREAILQEDNDPSHGTRSHDNKVQRLKRSNWITTIVHPAQSPDLNPQEGIWNILKQRVRRRYSDWNTIEELKAICVQEWDKITLQEVRARVNEMPWRCQQLRKHKGARLYGDSVYILYIEPHLIWVANFGALVP